MSRIEVDCLIDIERTAESFHAHAIPDGIEIRPGDRVVVHGLPSHVAFGDRMSMVGRATVIRAAWPVRAWTRLASLFELTELYEVGFAPKEVL